MAVNQTVYEEHFVGKCRHCGADLWDWDDYESECEGESDYSTITVSCGDSIRHSCEERAIKREFLGLAMSEAMQELEEEWVDECI